MSHQQTNTFTLKIFIKCLNPIFNITYYEIITLNLPYIIIYIDLKTINVYIRFCIFGLIETTKTILFKLFFYNKLIFIILIIIKEIIRFIVSMGKRRY